jgi:hypothetical protein
MSGAAIENVRVEDRFPAFNPFRIEVLEPFAGAAFCNISFTNIAVANFSTIRENPLVHPALPLPHMNGFSASVPPAGTAALGQLAPPIDKEPRPDCMPGSSQITQMSAALPVRCT